MQLHRLSAVLMLLTLQLIVPQKTHAQKFWGWLDELSGPGPFVGYLLVGDAFCLGSPPSVNAAAGLLAHRSAQINRATEEAALALFDQIEHEGIERGGPLTAYTAALEQMSKDPSFFKAHQADLNRFHRCRFNRSNNVVSLQIEFGRYDDRPAGDYKGDTDLLSLQAIAYVPVERLFTWNWTTDLSHRTRFLEAGIGVGMYGMTGDTLRHKDLWRGVIPIRVRTIPSEIYYAFTDKRKGVDPSLATDGGKGRLRRVLQAFQVRGGADWVLGTIDAELFTKEELRRSDKKSELNPTWGVNIDLGMLAKAAFGR